MNSVRTAVVTRPAQWQWHALEDDLVVGRAEASRRPDGRLFISVDAWHDVVFHQLAEAALAALPRPLHTVVDEADVDLTAQWRGAGFVIRRREWEHVVPTDPIITGLGAVIAPPGVTIVAAADDLLDEVDRAVRAENCPAMPAEILPGRRGLSTFTAAELDGRYAGLLRLAPLPRRPRIGLIAVRAGMRRRGIGRALLADTLATLHRRGVETVSADVHEANVAALALAAGVRARRVSSNLELELR
ncbi:GNAT family N-acetyltransferase [Actinoplanes cyaneus]|uniref:GNAT family N-acetyltransferase n=1 Tax=Actinoplanes cyaneus TaxID=52696 RepID=UPI001944EF4C|nr:GNAT family N-acetyltransferase [Actinoplanes cyaneus]